MHPKSLFPRPADPKGSGEWEPKSRGMYDDESGSNPSILFWSGSLSTSGRGSSGEAWNDASKKSNFLNSSPADFGEKSAVMYERPKLEGHCYCFSKLLGDHHCQQLMGRGPGKEVWDDASRKSLFTTSLPGPNFEE